MYRCGYWRGTHVENPLLTMQWWEGALSHILPTRSLCCRLEGLPPPILTPPHSHLGRLFQNQLEKLETRDPIIVQDRDSGSGEFWLEMVVTQISKHNIKPRSLPTCYHQKSVWGMKGTAFSVLPRGKCKDHFRKTKIHFTAIKKNNTKLPPAKHLLEHPYILLCR